MAGADKRRGGSKASGGDDISPARQETRASISRQRAQRRSRTGTRSLGDRRPARGGVLQQKRERTEADAVEDCEGRADPRDAADPTRVGLSVEKQLTRRSRYAQRSPPASTYRNLKGAVEISDTGCAVHDGGWLAGSTGGGQGVDWDANMQFWSGRLV